MSMQRLFLRRSAAYLIDILILFAILFPLGWVVVLASGFSPTSGLQIWWAILLNFSIPAWLYFTLSDSRWGGQTLGKRIFHLRVTNLAGGLLTLPQALLRTTVKLLPWELAHIGGFALADFPAAQLTCIILSNLLIVVDLGAALVTRGQRSVHDWAARTQVGSASALKA